MNTLREELIGEICHRLKGQLDDACARIMAEYEHTQSSTSRVEFGIVVYSILEEDTVTLSASPAPWSILARAMLQAAGSPDAKIVSAPPETLQ